MIILRGQNLPLRLPQDRQSVSSDKPRQQSLGWRGLHTDVYPWIVSASQQKKAHLPSLLQEIVRVRLPLEALQFSLYYHPSSVLQSAISRVPDHLG